MKFLDRFTIRFRLIIAFVIMLFMFVSFAAYSIVQMLQLSDLTYTLYQHPMKVSNAALSANSGVISMHRSMKDLALSHDLFGVQEAIKIEQSQERLVYKNLEVVKANILGAEGKVLIAETIDLFVAWKPIRVQVEKLVINGKREDAALITGNEGALHVSKLERKMAELTAYALQKADGFLSNAIQIKDRILISTLVIIAVVILVSAILAWLLIISLMNSVLLLKKTMSDITSSGKLIKAELSGNNEIAEMSQHFNFLIERLQSQFWHRDGLNDLNSELSGDLALEDLLHRSINFISRHTGACTGALYLYDRDRSLCELKASFAFVERQYLSQSFKHGEGIVGQVAVEKKPILLKNIKREELVGNTGTVSEPPRSIYTLPLFYEKRLYGVLEIASFEEIDTVKREMLDAAGLIISNAIYTASQSQQIKDLLASTQLANQELQTKTDELNESNEELTAMNDELKAQSSELKAQAEELEAQKMELQTQQTQVQEADRLKTEFLSNMSHELRTPLNSVLALSQLMLAKGTGINPQQEKEYLQVIERNGKRLLSLINDILDLSKIEAGKMDFFVTDFKPKVLIGRILETVTPLADQKNLKISSQVEDNLVLKSDEDKVYQIVLNLLTNAVKFSEQGEIEIKISELEGQISFSISDSGIGISQEEKIHIFDEFRQVDGSMTRSQEGTGLGLAICRKLARLLEGEITVESTRGEGSTFTLSLPLVPTKQIKGTDTGVLKGRIERFLQPTREDGDELPVPRAQKLTVLVIDDDDEVCALIKGYLTKAGYTVILAKSGQEGIELARRMQPFAITLDILMPDMDGWETIRQLKASPKTADIPVIIVSVSEDRETGAALGAYSYLVKPVDNNLLVAEIRKVELSKKVHHILVVDDDPVVRDQMENLLGGKGYLVETAVDGKQALAKVTAQLPDAMILDLLMPEMDGFTLLDKLAENTTTRKLPVIILTAKDLTSAEREQLAGSVNQVVLKDSMDTSLLLLEIEKILSSLKASRKTGASSGQRLILLVEDNEVAVLQIRTALEGEGYLVQAAAGGAEALELIKNNIPDAIILDLMMPEMDGFQVLEQLRSSDQTAHLPVLVLTAKELTTEDRARLRNNNIQELIQKGSMDRDQLKKHVNKLFREDLKPGGPQSSRKISAAKSTTQLQPAGKAGRNILVVEDNPDNLLSIKAILGDKDYKISSAGDGLEAVETAKKTRPDLILMDIQLPKLSGLDAARQIKSDPALTEVVIIAVTARAMRGDREKILAAGCDDYLAKPVNPEDLLSIIKKWLP